MGGAVRRMSNSARQRPQATHAESKNFSFPLLSVASPPFIRALHPPRSHHGPRILGGSVKRTLDVAIATALILALSPLLLMIWMLVRVESAGPGLFLQPRGGLGGKPFVMYKFRTMSVCESRNVAQARRGDPRVTRIGRFLRASSLDELPQLFNVVLGDMSLVGPRPHALEHDEVFAKMDPRYRIRQLARPGITGLAQISGCRGPTETTQKVRRRIDYDVSYVRRWSFSGDLAILVRTPLAILSCKNAL